MGGALSKAGPMSRAPPSGAAEPAQFGPGKPLKGTARIPGDKSISHRALMVAAMARGRSRIAGLSEGADVGATAHALRALGVAVGRDGAGWVVDGVGPGCLRQPRQALDMGNSGTSTRLLMGLIASHPITAMFTGDASLCRRPMDRVAAPLARVGAEVDASPGTRLPLLLRGLCPAVPAGHRLTVASAQVKSALLLAGLNIAGVTSVAEPVPTRDHSERMLAWFGADLRTSEEPGGGTRIALMGEAELGAREVAVPGDPSSAAFLIVAALIVPGSELRLEAIGINPMRSGLFETLIEMGADLTIGKERMVGPEPVADILVRHSALKGVDVPPGRVPAMIDEFPIFFIAAAFAEGPSRATGLGELRIKESDRIAAMAEGLRAIGARAEECDDGLVIEGSGGAPLPGGAAIDPRLDHRVAMSFAVAGLHCRAPLTVCDMTSADTSFPGFARLVARLAS